MVVCCDVFYVVFDFFLVDLIFKGDVKNFWFCFYECLKLFIVCDCIVNEFCVLNMLLFVFVDEKDDLLVMDVCFFEYFDLSVGEVFVFVKFFDILFG